MKFRALLLASLLMAAPTAARAADTYKVDPSHSSVAFRIKHMNVSYTQGLFKTINGSFTLDGDPSKCAFDFTVQADSVETGDPKRDQHLKNADFFNTKQFPTIRFKSTKVASAGQGAYEVTGDMTMHGVTRPVTVKVETVGSGPGMRGGSLAGLLSEFTIKRSEYEVKGFLPGVGDDVKLSVAVEGSRP